MHFKKQPLIRTALTAATGLFAASLYAQDTALDDPNWFSAGPAFGLNINASFKHLGNGSPATQPGPATGEGIDRTYDDGFVHVDSSGNAGGQTWNWGYQHSSQVQGDTVTMNAESANGTLHADGDPQMGFDLAYGRRLGKLWGGKWGFEAAFDFTEISIQDNSTFNGTAMLVSDSYSLGGNIAPDAPYSGSFEGPGTLLGDTPTRSTSLESVMITGHRSLDAQVYALRAGLDYEVPFCKRFSARFSGGLALAVADSKYSFNETATFESGAVVSRAGSSSGADVLVGGYVDAKLLCALTHHISIFAGAQYEDLGTTSRSVAGEQAQLNLEGSVNVLFGVQVSF